MHTINQSSTVVKPQSSTLSNPPPPLRARFNSDLLRTHFLRLFQPKELHRSLPKRPRGFYNRLFSPIIVLWYFLYLRMENGRTLLSVITDAHQGGADFLCPKDRPLSRRLRSWATTGFSNARQRFPLDVLKQALPAQAKAIRSWSEDLTWNWWNVFIVDGSTVRLRPEDDIPEHFPPHKNRQPEKEYWCLIRVVVCFCLRSAVLTASAMDAITTSEQELASQLIRLSLPRSLYMGDRNFGIYRFFQCARHAQAQAFARLTEARALKLAGGRALKPGLDIPVRWEHSRHDQLEPGASTDPIEGRLIVVQVNRPGFRTQTLYFFTLLTDVEAYPVKALLELYGWRWHVELNLRYMKTEMGLDMLNCKSADMVRKEWLAGALTYNLIRAAMLAAALEAKVPVLELSFSAAKAHVGRWLLEHLTNPSRSSIAWKVLLKGLACSRHPKRRKPRPAEPRAKRHVSESFPPLFGGRQQARGKLQFDPAKS